MKKPAKRVLIGLCLIICVIIILFISYMLKFRSETSKMTTLDTKELIPGIYAVKDDFVNMFLIKSAKGYIAIDAGNSAEKIKKELEKLNLDREKILAVLLTHTDADHIAGIDLFRNAKVFISKAEEQMINGQTNRALIFKNKLSKAHSFLEDNQEIVIDGIKIKCILTPGHTPGSMCYLLNDKFLFTGDTISLQDGKAALFNNFFNMDSENQIKSIKKISHFEKAQYLFTAHYGFSENYCEVFSD